MRSYVENPSDANVVWSLPSSVTWWRIRRPIRPAKTKPVAPPTPWPILPPPPPPPPVTTRVRTNLPLPPTLRKKAETPAQFPPAAEAPRGLERRFSVPCSPTYTPWSPSRTSKGFPKSQSSRWLATSIWHPQGFHPQQQQQRILFLATIITSTTWWAAWRHQACITLWSPSAISLAITCHHPFTLTLQPIKVTGIWANFPFTRPSMGRWGQLALTTTSPSRPGPAKLLYFTLLNVIYYWVYMHGRVSAAWWWWCSWFISFFSFRRTILRPGILIASDHSFHHGWSDSMRPFNSTSCVLV